MSLRVIGAGIFLASDLPGFSPPPEWRKATRNMIMATASIQRALDGISNLEVQRNDEVGLILGSSSGELDTSADFLTTLSRSKLARPLLFQNSLHNATTGFASIFFKVTGPSFTISSAHNTPGDCVELADTLLASGSCKLCIVTLVEAHRVLAEWIGESENGESGDDQSGIGEGACTVVLSQTEYGRELGQISAPFSDLNYFRSDRHAPLLAIEDSGFFLQMREWRPL